MRFHFSFGRYVISSSHVAMLFLVHILFAECRFSSLGHLASRLGCAVETAAVEYGFHM